MSWSMFIDVDAAEPAGPVQSVSFDLSTAIDAISAYKCTFGEVEYEHERVVFNNLPTTVEYSYFNYVDDNYWHLFNAQPDVYAYRLSFRFTDLDTKNYNNIIWQRFVVGFYDDIRSNGGQYVKETRTGISSTVWFVSEYERAPVYLDILSYCFYWYYSIYGSSSSVSDFASYDLSCHVELTIEPYTLAGYEKEIANNTEQIKDGIEQGNEIAKDTNETTKGIFASIKEFFGSFFQNLINAVVGLFVPSVEEMGDLFDQLNQFFSDRFGFLYAPFDYMIKLMQVFLSSTGTTGLTLPGFTIMGYEVWGDLTYDLSSDPLVGTILGYVRIGTGTLLSGYFIMFLQQFFKERFGSG